MLTVRFYTDHDLETLKRMFAEFYSLSEIAVELDRTPEALNQQVRRMGLKRNHHTVRMAYYHGRAILKFGSTPAAIKAAVAKKHELDKIKKIKERSQHQKNAIEGLKFDLANGTDRNHAIKNAYASGATLNQIGRVVHLSKQGVGLVIKPQKRDRW